MEPLPAAPRYDDWKAPKGDGETLVWPPPDELLRQAAENNRSLRAAEGPVVQGVPLPEVRRRLRHFIGHPDDDRPLFATGHQTELYHPGVWAKDVLIDAAAARSGGAATHFAVDTDAPKHLHLRWPGGSEPLVDADTAPAEWSGRLPAPTPAHLEGLRGKLEVARGSWGFTPAAGGFLGTMRRLALESLDLASALTNALHELDWNLGLRHGAMLTSRLWASEPYLVFAHHVLARAGDFAADYNASLADYRREKKIKSPGRPMPDLKCSAGACEAPFWFDVLGAGSRDRATVVRAGGRLALRAPSGDDDFILNPNADGWDAAARLLGWLRRHDVRLAPRALTLTTFLRLFAADQFVHGIGGAQYDQVTDRLVARHFRLDPPRFSVTTATLYFPEAVGQPRVCLPCVVQEGHRLKHDLLGAGKRQLVEAIAAAPRRSVERLALYGRMHDQLDAAAASHPAAKAWESRLRETQRREIEERTLFDRELFYAMQPKERLERIVATYRGQFG